MEIRKLDFVPIPNKVIHCKNLRANAKLLMGEIIVLSNGRGNCWASNQYFAEIFDVDRMTISKWIHSLEKNKFIKCKIKENHKRKIFIDPHISKSIEAYIKLSMGDSEKGLHIHKEQEQLESAALAIEDDFDIETKEWTDKDGKKHKRVSIDYGEENNTQ